MFSIISLWQKFENSIFDIRYLLHYQVSFKWLLPKILVASVLDNSCFLFLVMYLYHRNYHFMEIRKTSFNNCCILERPYSIWGWANQTRHHAEPNSNIILARNFPFESDVRQWSHPWMIQLHCLWAKWKNRTLGQFECDLTWFHFCFDFVPSHTRCGFPSIVCLCFQVVQIKQVECKTSTKNVNNYKKRHFMIFLNKCRHKSINPQKIR